MGSVTISATLEGVRSTLAAVEGIQKAMALGSMTEGMNTLPALEIYPASGDTDPSGSTDRTTFRAGVRQTIVTFTIDLYASERKHLGQDMSRAVTLLDSIIEVLEAQTAPFFGVTGLKAFSWRWERVLFERSNVLYTGMRFQLQFRIF